MMIEQQALELLVALHGERLEVQSDAFFERAARDPVREDADHHDRQQRQRNRHERQLPSDVQFQRQRCSIRFDVSGTQLIGTTRTVSSTSDGGTYEIAPGTLATNRSTERAERSVDGGVKPCVIDC